MQPSTMTVGFCVLANLLMAPLAIHDEGDDEGVGAISAHHTSVRSLLKAGDTHALWKEFGGKATLGVEGKNELIATTEKLFNISLPTAMKDHNEEIGFDTFQEEFDEKRAKLQEAGLLQTRGHTENIGQRSYLDESLKSSCAKSGKDCSSEECCTTFRGCCSAKKVCTPCDNADCGPHTHPDCSRPLT